FHNGQPQTGTASFFRMALIHPVEPLKDPLMVLFGDTDPCVCHADFGAIQCIADPDGYSSAIVIILNSVFTYIVDHFIQNLTDTYIFYRFSGQFHPDIFLERLRGEAAYDLP